MIQITILFISISKIKYKEQLQNLSFVHLYKNIQLIFYKMLMELINIIFVKINGIKYYKIMELDLVLHWYLLHQMDLLVKIDGINCWNKLEFKWIRMFVSGVLGRCWLDLNV